jgi:hypothetical protein
MNPTSVEPARWSSIHGGKRWWQCIRGYWMLERSIAFPPARSTRRARVEASRRGDGSIAQ